MVCKKESDKLINAFLQVIEDVSSYLFSYNHALPYSMIGYMCGWLRYYYPLEFMATYLQINKNKSEKTLKAMNFIKEFTNIKLKPIKFRYSTSSI